MRGRPVALESEARVSIATPRRYLGRLCKHFGHRILVSHDADFGKGRIVFPPAGACALEADDGGGLLTMRVTAGNETDLARLEDVVGRHLQRFAFREPVAVTWTRSARQAVSFESAWESRPSA